MTLPDIERVKEVGAVLVAGTIIAVAAFLVGFIAASLFVGLAIEAKVLMGLAVSAIVTIAMLIELRRE